MQTAVAYPPEANTPERARKLLALRERDPDWHDPDVVSQPTKGRRKKNRGGKA